MTEALRHRVERELAAASAWQAGQDPTPVASALGYAIALEALGLRELLSPAEARTLGRVGNEAVLAWTPPDSGGEDLDDERLAHRRVRDVARAGLASLQAGARSAHVRSHALHPPSATLVGMLAGGVDGLTAGRYALHVLSCRSCRDEVALLRTRAASRADPSGFGRRLAVAASKPGTVRPPAGGRVVATREEPAVEAVLFDDADGRRLAVYARAQVPVRMVAADVTTEETLAGYWIGRVDAGVQRLDAALHVGTETFGWTVPLG